MSDVTKRKARRTLAANVGLAALALASVVWEAPPSCPDADFVNARLATYLGDAVADYEVDARVVQDASRYEATVRITGSAGTNTRVLDAVDCRTLADAVALVAAVDIDVLSVAASPGMRRALEPAGGSGAGAGPSPGPSPSPRPRPRPGLVPAPAPAPAPPPAPAPASASAPAPAPAPARTPTRDLRLGVRFDVGVGIGPLPAPNLLAGLTVALLVRRWRFELGGAHHFSRPGRLPSPNEAAGADVALWAANVRARWVPSVNVVEFPLGLGIELGDMVADGVEVANSVRRHGFFGAGIVGVGFVVVPHPRVALWLDPALTLTFARPGFAVVAPGAGLLLAHEPAIPGFRAAFGLEVRFP